MYLNTVNHQLKNALTILMKAAVFSSFRLVGGTALSLQLGHRESIDIDLFSDVSYGSIDFNEIEYFLKRNFEYVDFLNVPPAFGRSYFIGESPNNSIKLDVFYTDAFIQPFIEKEGIRMATVAEIIAMKLDVVQRVGRKKDFWDLHELLNAFTINQMIELHKQRYPFSHDSTLIIQHFTNFTRADDDFDPICYKGKYWEFIKDDFEDAIKNGF
ncbi:MAG: hypothetical protein CFE24_02290 [Flavobacterium sp. BFFFF2]|nr:MAG: hypothetical protein CFE24_02290 [Flavobacterium sp. BFFFF2]